MVADAWRGSAVVATVAGSVRSIGALERWQQLRAGAYIVLASTLLAGPFLLAMADGWPMVAVWALSLAVSAGVFVAARPIAAAVNVKRTARPGTLSIEAAV